MPKNKKSNVFHYNLYNKQIYLTLCHHHWIYSTQVKRNSTCTDIDSKIQDALADINIYINLFKGLLGPCSLIIMGSLSDLIGKKPPIIFILALNFLWAATSLVNSIFISTFPTWMFIVQSGVLPGLMGGSNSTMCTLQMAYVAWRIPVEKRASRFYTRSWFIVHHATSRTSNYPSIPSKSIMLASQF